MNVNDFADFCLRFFTFVYFDFTFSMLLYKIYCAKYIKLSVEICANTRLKYKYETPKLFSGFHKKTREAEL